MVGGRVERKFRVDEVRCKMFVCMELVGVVVGGYGLGLKELV